MRLGDHLWCWLRKVWFSARKGMLLRRVNLTGSPEGLAIDGHEWKIGGDDIIRCETCGETGPLIELRDCEQGAGGCRCTWPVQHERRHCCAHGFEWAREKERR